MVLTIGDRSMPLRENETLNLYAGTVPPRGRIIRSATFARNVAALAAYLAR